MGTLFTTKVAAAKPAEKDYKLSDCAGLYLLVRPNGAKLWRLNYVHCGKHRTLSFGAWPHVGLADARCKRDEARRLIAAGLDPSHEEKVARAKARVEENDTFKTVAKEWIAKNEREGMAEITLSKIRWLLDKAYPKIGNRPIAKITTQEVLVVLRAVEATGRYESARRMRSVLGRVFRYAVSTTRAERDPTGDLRGALTVPKSKHLAAITTANRAGDLMRAIEGYTGHGITLYALRLSAHLFVRPGEIRQAEWAEFDFDHSVWPPSFSLVASGADRPELAAKAAPDALAGAPANYGDVPRLGPPLPGDLGRPILEHQRETGAAIPGPAVPDPAVAAAQRAAQEAETERQRFTAERQAARQSGVMMQLANGARPDAPAATTTTVVNAQAPSGGETSAGTLNRREQLVGRANTESGVNPHRLTAPASPYMLSAGSIIAASLITGLNSDLPGFVTAQVTENAYDTATGQILLIPQDARLIGSYDSVVAFGQSRALVVWQRIVLPDGSSIRIDNVPATDLAGYAGLSDRIDRHTWQFLKGVALSTLLGVGTELSFGSSESDLVRAIRESAQQSGARAGNQLVTRNLNVQPTLRVRPGWPLRVIVHRDIVLPRSWGGRHG